jgi:hypothetical protein
MYSKPDVTGLNPHCGIDDEEVKDDYTCEHFKKYGE